MAETTAQRLAAEYIAEKSQSWRPRTKQNYAGILNRFAEHLGDTWPPARADLMSFFAGLDNAASVWSYFGHLKSWLNYLVATGELEAPTAAAEIQRLRLLPKRTKYAPKAIPVDEARRLIVHLDGLASENELSALRDLAAIHLALVSGIRSGELVNLRISDIDLSDLSARIDADQAKDGEERRVYYNQAAADHLAAWQATLEQMDYGGEWLFPAFVNQCLRIADHPLTIYGLNQMWHRRLDEAGLPARRFHSTRHAAALQAIDSGIGLHHIQRQLGHQSLLTTMAYLVGRDQERQAAWAEVSYAL